MTKQDHTPGLSHAERLVVQGVALDLYRAKALGDCIRFYASADAGSVGGVIGHMAKRELAMQIDQAANTSA